MSSSLFHICLFPSFHTLHFMNVFLSLPSTRPWDPLNDLIQFEKDGCIQTKVRHRTPMVRSGSLISLSNQGPRRDNCKCQVGRPDRKKKTQLAASATFHAAPGAPSSLLLLLFVSLSPLLLFCLFLCLYFFFSILGTCCSLCMGGSG